MHIIYLVYPSPCSGCLQAPLPLVDKRAFFNGGEGGIRTIEILTKATQTGGFFVILSLRRIRSPHFILDYFKNTIYNNYTFLPSLEEWGLNFIYFLVRGQAWDFSCA